MNRKDFKKWNTGFECMKCSAKNSPAAKSERNHCAVCLYSLHVDEETPGDRISKCFGLMEPRELDYRGSKGFLVLHCCTVCRKSIWNKAAEDDQISNFYANVR